MTDIYQVANIGLTQGQQRLEAFSQNAASATLPGYRRHIVTGRAFDAALATIDAPQGMAADATTARDVQSPLTPRVDLQPGQPMMTGRALDLAIDANDQYFALTDGAQTWLTRAGAFHLDDDGVLVGERNLHVVGAQGDIHLPGADLTIESDGRVTHEGVTVATLLLFRPQEKTSLRAAAGTLLTADGIEPVDAAALRLRAGTLEASNTDSTREMLGLMSLSRQFESLSRVVQSYDAVLGRAIQTLGAG